MNGFSANLVSALILWRFGKGLLRGKFRQFLTEFGGGRVVRRCRVAYVTRGSN